MCDLCVKLINLNKMKAGLEIMDLSKTTEIRLKGKRGAPRLSFAKKGKSRSVDRWNPLTMSRKRHRSRSPRGLRRAQQAIRDLDRARTPDQRRLEECLGKRKMGRRKTGRSRSLSRTKSFKRLEDRVGLMHKSLGILINQHTASRRNGGLSSSESTSS